jgi:hypothetical protein
MNDIQSDNRNHKTIRVVTLSFLVLGLAGIVTTAIVDYVLNDGFTWSLLHISAILFSWLCVWPLPVFKKRGSDIALFDVCHKTAHLEQAGDPVSILATGDIVITAILGIKYPMASLMFGICCRQ